MTDDLERQLTERLRQRAGRVTAPADLGDVHHRITDRHRRRNRALGAALAIALVAGPLAGWALARTTEPDVDTVTASGAGTSTGGDDVASNVSEGFWPYSGPPIANDLHPVSARTTGDGIRVVVHSSDLGQSNGPCHTLDGVVRVGVNDRDLIDVHYVNTAPGGASFVIAGTADARPMWVVVVRGYETVEATFPNGAVDATDATDGLAVLAAFAAAGQPPEELADDVIQLEGDAMVDMSDARTALLDDGAAGCDDPSTVVPPQPDVVMPQPGEPPADEEAARAEITDLFSLYGGVDAHEQVDLHEEPDVWLDAQLRFQEQTPEYFEWAQEVYGVVDEIVFTAPDRATVRYSLVSDDPSIPAPGERLGEAVLIDGMWKVSIETSCDNLALAGIECDR